MARVENSAPARIENRTSRPSERLRDDRADSEAKAKEKPAAEPVNRSEGENTTKLSIRDRLKEHWLLTAIGLVVAAVCIAFGIVYWLQARHFETTDDAFIDARSFSVAAKVGGYVTDVFVTDNQHVTAGQPLAQIDERDYRISLDQAQAQVAAAEANIANVDAQIFSQQAQIEEAKAQAEQAEAQLRFAQQEAARAQDLVNKGAGTVQRQQQTNSDLNAQQANTTRARTAVTAATRQINVLEAQKQSAKAQLAQAQAQLEQAQLNLGYTRIVAAQSGRVVKLGGAKGAFVNPGQSVMMFVPDDIWITANYKENPGHRHAAGAAGGYPDRRLSGPQDHRSCGLRAARVRYRLQPVAGGERDRQLRQGGAAHPGEDRRRSMAE
ncbi:membrane fusion protein (multidrug efflux system) [Nitrobacteraceae bacterium AZCC 2299]